MAKQNLKSNYKLNTITLAAIVAISVVAGFVIAKTFAATSTSSIKLDQTSPYLGGLVTFTTSYPRVHTIKGAAPRIAVMCFQDVNGDGTINTTDTLSPDLVYAEAGSADQTYQKSLTGSPGFILGGGASSWLTRGGAATCKADLYYYSAGKGTDPEVYNFLATTGTWQAAGAK